ncbi:hypothetical protein HD806DRAFT_527272 [Xylariaceae sp. AK1471]|nr:hypothetical protein HD806DRAFT_527272 [Xylariaceae sp. AK1471]
MKYVSQYSDRLSRAYKKIEGFKKEIIRLQNKIATLQTTKIHKEPQSLPTCSVKNVSSDNKKHYAQPTTSSRNKGKPETQQLDKDKGETRRAVIINNNVYVYVAGVPTRIPSRNEYSWVCPSFMRGTRTSYRREACNRQENLKRKDRIKKPQQPATPPDSLHDSRWGSCDNEVIRSLPETLPQPSDATPPPRTPLDIDEKDDKLTGDDLAQRTRLDEGLDPECRALRVLIDSKTGLDFLRKAAEIVQRAIFHVWETKEPKPFPEGLHLVRLGRDELMRWVGEYPSPHLAHNGHSAREIHSTLLEVVPLRNAISRPTGSELRNATSVDWLLGTIRDALRSEANKSLQFIKDLYYLAIQPFHEVIDYRHHHFKMFKNALYLMEHNGWTEQEKKYSKEIIAVAQAWAGQR